MVGTIVHQLTKNASIEEIKEADLIVIDFHAEATAEKIALSYYLDGDVTVVYGTHTHVQTADGKVLPKGTGYITEVLGTTAKVSDSNAPSSGKNTFISTGPIMVPRAAHVPRAIDWPRATPR